MVLQYPDRLALARSGLAAPDYPAVSYSRLSDNLMVSDVRWCPVIEELLNLLHHRPASVIHFVGQNYPHRYQEAATGYSLRTPRSPSGLPYDA